MINIPENTNSNLDENLKNTPEVLVQSPSPEQTPSVFIDQSTPVNATELIRQTNYGDVGYQPKDNEVLKKLDLENSQDRSLVKDSFVQNNALVSGVDAGIDYFEYLNEKQKGYSPIKDDPDALINLPDDVYEDAISARSQKELMHILNRYSNERAARENIANSGTEGVLMSMGAAILDPINFIPIVGQTTKAKMAVAAGTAALDEVFLQANQYERSKTESAINIGGAALTVGLINGIASKMNVRSENIKQLNQASNSNPDDLAELAAFAEPKSLSAASSPNINVWRAEDTQPVFKQATNIASLLGAVGGVGQRLLNSTLEKSRYFTNELFDHGFVLKGHEAGKVSNSVESLIDARKSNYAHEIDSAYRTGYAQFVKKATELNPNISKESISEDVFNTLVHKAIVSGTNESADEISNIVMKTANSFSKVYKDLGDNLQKMGRIDSADDVMGAVNYFPRDFDRRYILDNQAEVIDRLKNLILQKFKDNPKVLASAEAKSDASKFIPEEEALDISQRIYKSIAFGDNAFPTVTSARKVKLDDTDLMFAFSNDIRGTTIKYLNRTVPKVELYNKFDTTDVNWFLKEMDDEAFSKRSLVENDFKKGLINESQQKSKLREIENQLKADKENFQSAFNRLVGNSTNNDPTSVWLNIIGNYLTSTKMGSALLASLNDIGATTLINGPIKTMEHYFKPLVEETGIKALRKSEISKLVTGFDELTNGKASSIFENIDLNGTNFAGEFSSKLSEFTLKYSGLPKWTTFGQGISGSIAVDKILIAAEKLKAGGKLAQSEITFFAQHGMNEDLIRKTLELAEKHGDVKNRILGVEKWDNDYANMISANVQRMVNSSIVRVGASTLPKYMDSPYAKLAFKFQSFGFAAWQRILITGLQRSDANFYYAGTMMTAVALLANELRSNISGREQPKEWDAKIMSAVQGTGIGFFPVSMYDKFGGLVGSKPSYKFMASAGKEYEYKYGQPDWARVVGPIGSLAKDSSEIFGSSVGSKHFTQKTIDAIRHLLPANNLWYAQNAFDQLSRGIAEVTGTPYKTKGAINEFIEGR